MKIIITVFLMISMLAATLASCQKSDEQQPSYDQNGNYASSDNYAPGDKYAPGDNSSSDTPITPITPPVASIPDGLTGIDVSKLLLAGERLGNNILSNGEDIFANGVEVYKKLAAKTEESYKITFLSDTTEEVRDPSLPKPGDVITEFNEISRNFAEFESTADRIIEQAKHGADTIDFVKKHIRILDTWVKIGTEKYYLHVEENSETIYRRSEERISICHRYKNEDGDDVYEMYDNYGFESIRSTYIEGKRYALISDMMGNGTRYQGISANKDKGYWEVFDVIHDKEWLEDVFATNFVILKEDICYKVGFNRRDGNYLVYTITTPNRKSDILVSQDFMYSTTFSFNLACFTGYKGVIWHEGNIGTLLLDNGLTIHDTDLDLWEDETHKTWINGIRASDSTFGYEGEMTISIDGGTVQSRRDTFIKILTERLGLTCKYDMNAIFALIDAADAEYKMMRDHLRWNGHSVNSHSSLMKGVEAESKRFSDMHDMYLAIKDAASVDFTDKPAVELLINFPELVDTKSSADVDKKKVTLSNVSLTVNDTALFVDKEPYKVAFSLVSLADENAGLIHIDAQTETKEFTSGEKTFTVTANNVSLELPVLPAGEYALVAYISTADGIRSSKYLPVTAGSVSEETIKERNVIVASQKSADGTLKIIYTEVNDVEVTLKIVGPITYNALYNAIAEAAFEYGILSDELLASYDHETDVKTALSGDETDIPEGTYIGTYSSVNGGNEIRGDVYAKIVAVSDETPEQPEQPADPADEVREVLTVTEDMSGIEFAKELSVMAAKYGTPAETIEADGADGNFEAFAPTEDTVTEGVYRIGYTLGDGSNGYLYVKYIVN